MVHIYKNIIYNNKNFLSGAFIISNGKEIYEVDSSGYYQRENLFATKGSGSTFVKTFLEDNAKQNLTAAQAKQLVVKAVSYSVKYDGSSGGCIRTFDIRDDGSMDKEFHDYFTFALQD